MGGGDRWRASRVKKEQSLGVERESINQTYGVIAGGVTLRPPPHRSRGDWSAERATEGSERGGRVLETTCGGGVLLMSTFLNHQKFKTGDGLSLKSIHSSLQDHTVKHGRDSVLRTAVTKITRRGVSHSRRRLYTERREHTQK